MDERTFARVLGWSCLALGAVALAAPGPLGRALGLGDRRRLVRAMGVRDVVTGAGLVAARDPRPWLRARMAVEVADATMHAAGAATGALRPGRATVMAASAAALAGVELAVLRR